MPKPSTIPAAAPAAETADGELNNRRAPRRSFVHFAWFQRIDSSEAEPAQGVVRSCDVAEKGVGFLATQPLPRGARLFLVLVSPMGRVSAVGTVAHCRLAETGYHRIGVAIDIVPPTDQAIWAAITRSAGQ